MMFRLRLLPLLASAMLAGCATTPLPDGRKIQRLAPDAATPTPALTAEEKQRLAQLNTRLLAEQDAAIAREAREEAWRRMRPYGTFDLYYGHPGWYGSEHRGRWHPGWSFGLGWYGPWPY